MIFKTLAVVCNKCNEYFAKILQKFSEKILQLFRSTEQVLILSFF